MAACRRRLPRQNEADRLRSLDARSRPIATPIRPTASRMSTCTWSRSSPYHRACGRGRDDAAAGAALLPKTRARSAGTARVGADDWFTPPRCAYTAQTPRCSATPAQQHPVSLPQTTTLMQAIRWPCWNATWRNLGGLGASGMKGVKLSGGIQRAAARMFVAPGCWSSTTCQRAGRGNGRALWAHLRTPRRRRPADLPGRLAPQSGPAPRWPHYRHTERAHRRAGTLDELLEICEEMQRLYGGRRGHPARKVSGSGLRHGIIQIRLCRT